MTFVDVAENPIIFCYLRQPQCWLCCFSLFLSLIAKQSSKTRGRTKKIRSKFRVPACTLHKLPSHSPFRNVNIGQQWLTISVPCNETSKINRLQFTLRRTNKKGPTMNSADRITSQSNNKKWEKNHCILSLNGLFVSILHTRRKCCSGYLFLDRLIHV